MAQIIYFWGKPASYNGFTYNWNTMALKVDYTNANTNPYTHPEYYTGIAHLMRDIGSTWGNGLWSLASYGAISTGANDADCDGVFTYFGYSPTTRTNSILTQTLSGAKNGTTYNTLLTNELQNNKRPCMVGGYTDESSGLGLGILPIPKGDAHEWVCDGSSVSTYYSGYTNTYKSFYGVITTQTTYTSSSTYSYLHMNWGWDGKDINNNILSNNGWYDCTTNYTQASSSSPNYQYFQTVIYNIIHP